jgi:LuxR family maltose regulon positive regulatory protein
MTADTLLETKLHLPIAHGRLVPRARLSDQLAGATAATLTLVSAPAGFGKTTLIAELANRADGARIAWLSLDAGDNDPVTFWTYVVEAIDRAAPGLMTGARSSLAAGQVSVDAVVTALLNGLVAADADVILVLDDLHVLESPAINEQLGYFLDHLPARGHVVAGTRADPAIPLARLRARGGLIEIRASDLRFSPAEAARYLESMGLVLRDGDVDLLEGRTEGWIAALQLAALSLRGRDDTTAFISAFAGDDRHIVDYLVEEVLRRQPARIRDFLLKTSILSRFTGSLADAVTASEDGAATVEALDRANLFVVALDSQRRWYRYHHLFGGVLQAHLVAEMPAEVAMLHRRASDWFDEHGDRPTAVEHAFRAGDPERTAELVELAAVEMRQYRREATLRAWIAALPRDVIAQRPLLAVGLAGTTLSANEVEGVDELLTGAERLLAAGEPILIIDEAERRRLPAMIELYRAALSKLQGDVAGNVAHARRVLELGDPDDDIGRGGAETFLGLAAWGLGDLDQGYEWYEKGMASLERGGLLTDVVGAGMIGADIRVAAGRLTDAMRIYEEGLARATQTQPPLRGATDMHTGLADISYQRGRLDEAQAHIEAGRRLGDQLGFPREPYRWRLVRARILQAQGDIDAALPLLEEAERLYLSEFSPDIHPIPAIRARMLVAHGRTGEARAWANRAGLLSTDELTYVREYEHLTLARLLVAEAADGRDAALPAALALLERLLTGAENGRRDGSRLEILVVQALARQGAGDGAGSFIALDGAIELGEGEGYVRVFLDEGAPMRRLLNAAAKRSKAPGYIHELVRASTGATGVAGPSPARQALAEQLSEREVEVLRLLRSDLDGPGMARELVVSLNTLRSHTKNIYAKLGVGSRRAAVRRGEELDLI